MRPSPAISVLMISCFVVAVVAVLYSLASCTNGFRFNYRFDVVRFVISGDIPPAVGPAPNIHIDSNLRVSGMMGGTVKTSKPYSIGIDYTDATFTAAEMVFTNVTVTYADGTIDPGAAALNLPLRIKARPYESTNSGAGGRIFTTKVRVISGRIPGAITRDMPFTLRLDGKLINDDGSETPFAVEYTYDAVTDERTRSWGEVMQDTGW